MYARITKYQVTPSMLDDMVARFDEIGAQLSKIPGTLVAYNAWNDDGESVVFGIYESEAAAEAAVRRRSQSLARAPETKLTQPPVITSILAHVSKRETRAPPVAA